MRLIEKTSEKMTNFTMLPEEFWKGDHYPSWKHFQANYLLSNKAEKIPIDDIDVDHLVDFVIFNCSNAKEATIELDLIKCLFLHPPSIKSTTLFHKRGCELLRMLNKMIYANDSVPTKWFESLLTTNDESTTLAINSNDFMLQVVNLVKETGFNRWDINDFSHLYLFIADIDSKEAISMQDFLVAQRKLKLTSLTTKEFNLASEDLGILHETMKDLNLTFGQLRKIISESHSPERTARKTVSEAALQRNLGSSRLTVMEVDQMLLALARMHEEHVTKLEQSAKGGETRTVSKPADDLNTLHLPVSMVSEAETDALWLKKAFIDSTCTTNSSRSPFVLSLTSQTPNGNKMLPPLQHVQTTSSSGTASPAVAALTSSRQLSPISSTCFSR
jgi:hypothetical protein